VSEFGLSEVKPAGLKLQKTIYKPNTTFNTALVTMLLLQTEECVHFLLGVNVYSLDVFGTDSVKKSWREGMWGRVFYFCCGGVNLITSPYMEKDTSL